MNEASLEHSIAAARQEHLVPGREIHMQGLRGRPFCEIALITGSSQDNAITNIWNTTGACEPTSEQLDALDTSVIARENGAVRAWLSPIRHWLVDRLDAGEVGDDRAFGDITGTWMRVDAEPLMEEAAHASYDPRYIHRDKGVTFTFNEGSKVYLLDAPDGEMFVMQSLAQSSDPALGDADFAPLGLPDGWGFRAVTLDQDLEVSSNIDNLAHVLHDDLHNVYQGSDAGRAFSGIWPANPPGYAL